MPITTGLAGQTANMGRPYADSQRFAFCFAAFYPWRANTTRSRFQGDFFDFHMDKIAAAKLVGHFVDIGRSTQGALRHF